MAKKIITVLNNLDLLKFLSKNALCNFDNFSRKETRRKWLEILKYNEGGESYEDFSRYSSV